MTTQMTQEQIKKHASLTKLAWIGYFLLCVLIIAALVLFKAADNEERVFFFLMGSAALYVFRPTEKFFNRHILRIMKIPEDSNEA